MESDSLPEVAERVDTAERRVKVRLVAVERTRIRKGKGEKLAYSYAVLTDEMQNGRLDDADRRVYSGKILGGGRVGSVIEVDAEYQNPTTIYKNSARVVGLWEPEEYRRELKVKEAVVDIAMRMDRESTAEPWDALEPFREAYWKATGRERAALLARVTMAVMSPRSLLR